MIMEVVLTQMDFLENEKKIYPKVMGYLSEDVLSYQDKETGNKHTITFCDEYIRFLNEGNFSSDTTLKENDGKAIVNSPYGRMKFETKCINKDKNDDFWSVEYQILDGNQVITHQKMIWEFKKVYQSS